MPTSHSRRSGTSFELLNQQLRQQATKIAADRERATRRAAQQANSHHLFLRSDGSYGSTLIQTPRRGR